MLQFKQYIRPRTLEEAYTLNQSRRNKIIGGMLWLKMTGLRLNTVIDLCDLGLDTIEETDDGFSLGAMVTLRQLECHEGLNAYTNGAVAKAVQDIVGVQFRNCATLGGSLFGRFGFSDVLTVLMPLECTVKLYKAGEMTLKEFSNSKRDNDILLGIHIKKTPGRFAYCAMRNTRTDLPTLTCAVAKIGDTYRAAIGARPAGAALVEAATAEALMEKVTALPMGSNLRGSAAYRRKLAQVLTQRALGGV